MFSVIKSFIFVPTYSVVIKNEQVAYILLVKILQGHVQEEANFTIKTVGTGRSDNIHKCPSTPEAVGRAKRKSRQQLTENYIKYCSF